jgi:hypothetical protein
MDRFDGCTTCAPGCEPGGNVGSRAENPRPLARVRFARWPVAEPSEIGNRGRGPTPGRFSEVIDVIREKLRRYVIPTTVRGQAIRIAVIAATEAEARTKAREVAERMERGTDARGLLHRLGAA